MTNASASRHAIPKWIWLWFLASFAGVCGYVGRMVWEQTLLTWKHGLQMVGFTLVHAELGLFFFFLGSTLLFGLAYATVLVLSLIALFRRRRVSFTRWLTLVATAMVLSLLFVPYSMWQRIFAAKLAHSPHAASFLVYAAATGDLPTVEAFLRNGVSINAKNEDGTTALNGAAVEGQLHVIRYLLAHGADPNIRNDFGHTALDNAREMKRGDAVRYLQEHGAK